MQKLLAAAAGLLVAGLLSAAPDCSQVYHFSTRPSDQADGVVTFTAVGATPGVNNKLFGCSAWIMNVDVEGLSGSSVTLQSAPQGGPNFAGAYVTFAGTLSSGSNPTTTTTSSTSLFTGYYPWLRVNVGTMTGTGSINIQLFGWRSQAYLTAATGSGAVADGTTICGTTTFSICANGVDYAQIATDVVQTVTISGITSTQLKNTDSAPIALIAAPGSGKVIDLIDARFDYTFGTLQYVSGTGLNYAIGTTIMSCGLQQLTATNITGATTNAHFYSYGCAGSTQTSAAILNQGIFLRSIAPLSTGDGTASITLHYRIISGLS